jgi:hypothetical protein
MLAGGRTRKLPTGEYVLLSTGHAAERFDALAIVHSPVGGRQLPAKNEPANEMAIYACA